MSSVHGHTLNFSSIASAAYTAVHARTTFSRPFANSSIAGPVATTSNAGPSREEKSKRQWSTSVREYVQRAFAADNAIPTVSRQEMEVRLKHIISAAAESHRIDEINWNTHPLPQQIIQDEQIKIQQTQANAIWSDSFPTLQIQDTNVKPNEKSKKRKSSDRDDETLNSSNVSSPWKKQSAAQPSSFEDRLSYPQKHFRSDVSPSGKSKSRQPMDHRKQRFGNTETLNGKSSKPPWIQPERSTPTVDQGPVVGQCQDLEKKYFRLTSAPNPMTVRPLAVLEKTLDHLKRKWRKENNYAYICDQFKSLRQDLTVQHIKTDFTVNVYEIHARIALEKGDLGEYNQCQTQLRALYAQQLGGHPMEFKAYRILYFIHTSNRTEMNDVLADLTPAEKEDAAVKHALDTRSALALGNHHRFFQLYLDTPNMGAYLMDMFVERERLFALSSICKAWVASSLPRDLCSVCSQLQA